MRDCIFCHKEMKLEISHNDRLDVFACRDCQKPKYKTVYRCISYRNDPNIAHDLILVDDYCITRWYQSLITVSPYTLIYRNVVGVLKGVFDMDKNGAEPLSISNPIIEMSGIIDINVSDLDKLKHKMNTWITFS